MEDFKFPAIKLNRVVFPEPFGPIIPVIEPFLILREQLDTAAIHQNILIDFLPVKYFQTFNLFLKSLKNTICSFV